MSGCNCGKEKTRLIYACSGTANTGSLSDTIVRKLASEACVTMTCLFAIGADLSGFIKSAEAADENILIDGCSIGCAKRIFENKNLPFSQYVLIDYGVEKGKTVITEEVISDTYAKVSKDLQIFKP